jgi:hypothetical protein
VAAAVETKGRLKRKLQDSKAAALLSKVDLLKKKKEPQFAFLQDEDEPWRYVGDESAEGEESDEDGNEETEHHGGGEADDDEDDLDGFVVDDDDERDNAKMLVSCPSLSFARVLISVLPTQALPSQFSRRLGEEDQFYIFLEYLFYTSKVSQQHLRALFLISSGLCLGSHVSAQRC